MAAKIVKRPIGVHILDSRLLGWFKCLDLKFLLIQLLSYRFILKNIYLPVIQRMQKLFRNLKILFSVL